MSTIRNAFFLVLTAVMTHLLGGLEPSAAGYIGADRCRLCHRSVYNAWSRTPHQRATETIPPEAMTPGCLLCHATGPQALRGVQCEACHGPGGNYSPADVMLDPEKARLAGLLDPTESVCRSCHGTGPPGHSPSFTMPGEDEKRRFIH